MELVKKIDIHVHSTVCTWPGGYANAEELIGIYDNIGVEKGVILPEICVEGGFHISTNYDAKCIVDQHPDRFEWFCNIDPRQGSNTVHTDFTRYIQFCQSMGAKGVGEICSNVYFDDPLMLNLFKHCEANDMPVIFHIGNLGGDYGLVDEIGLPRMEKVLQMFPKLRLLGHSQKFWAEISGDLTPEQRDGYPTGKVVPGGRLVELLRKYPNLCGDLSAGSGYNAVTRDPEFGYAFLEEFQDRMFYGTDICSPKNADSPSLKLAAFLDEGVLSGKLSYDAYYKISRGNAEKLLNK